MKKLILTSGLLLILTICIGQTKKDTTKVKPTKQEVEYLNKLKIVLEQSYRWLPTSQIPALTLNGTKDDQGKTINLGVMDLINELYQPFMTIDTPKKSLPKTPIKK